MPQGMQIFDASGATVVDTNVWMSQVLGSFTLAGPHAAGSLTDANLAQGRPLLIVLPEQGNTGTNVSGNPVTSSVTISDNTVNWNAAPYACRVIYGIY
jgi:hypothetical protein